MDQTDDPIGYPKPELSAEQEANIIRLADEVRSTSGFAQRWARELLDDAMEQAWIRRHRRAGVRWSCNVRIEDPRHVLAWAREHGFDPPSDGRKLKTRLVHFIEHRLKNGESVTSEGLSLESEVVVHEDSKRVARFASPR